MKVVKTILRISGWAMIGLLIVAVGAAFILPLAIGGRALTVLTGSMIPTLNPGDIAVIVPTNVEDLEIGDTIAFLPYPNDPTLITHRIIEKQLGTNPKILTQGDANSNPDDPIQAIQIIGRTAYRIPLLGYITRTGPYNLAALLLSGTVIVGGVAWSRWRTRAPLTNDPAISAGRQQ